MQEEMNRMKQEYAKKVENLIEKISMLQVQKKNLKEEKENLLYIKEYGETDYVNNFNPKIHTLGRIFRFFVVASGAATILSACMILSAYKMPITVTPDYWANLVMTLGIEIVGTIGLTVAVLIADDIWDKKCKKKAKQKNILHDEFIKEMDTVNKEYRLVSKELKTAMKELKKLKDMATQVLLEKTPEMIEKQSEYEMQQYYQTFCFQNINLESTMPEMDIQKNPYEKTI